MLINKRKFSIKNDKKLLHKVGKQWVTVSVAMLALLGAGVVTTETTHAESNQNKSQIQVNVTKANLNQKLVNANNQTTQKNSKNGKPVTLTTSNQPTNSIEKVAKGLHSTLVNNVTKVESSTSNSNNSTTNNDNTVSQSSASSSKAKAMTPHINSAYANYLKQMGGNSAYDKLMNKEVQSQNTNNTKNNKPKVNLKLTKNLTDAQQVQPTADRTHWIYTSDGNGHVNYLSSDQVHDWQNSTRDYDGLSYKYSPSMRAVEFTGGTLKDNYEFMTYEYSSYAGAYIRSPDYISNAKSIIFRNNISTGSVTNMSDMFEGADSLRTLILSNAFNTSNVTNMNNMFEGLSSLRTLTLPDTFNTSNVTDMNDMFEGDASLQTLILPDTFNTSNVTNMSYMFGGLNSLQKLSLPNAFNTGKVTNMQGMFEGDASLQTLSLPNSFNTSYVTNMSDMFENETSLQKLLLPDSFNTSYVTNMQGMFEGETSLQKLTLPDVFDTNNVNEIWGMFSDDKSLQTLTLSENFNTDNIPKSDMFDVFRSDNNLQRITVNSNGTSLYNYISDPPFDSKTSDAFPFKMYKLYEKKDSNGINYTSADPNDFSQGNIGTFVRRRNPQMDTIIYKDVYSDIDGLNFYYTEKIPTTNEDTSLYLPGDIGLVFEVVNKNGKPNTNNQNYEFKINLNGSKHTIYVAPQYSEITYKYNKANNTLEYMYPFSSESMPNPISQPLQIMTFADKHGDSSDYGPDGSINENIFLKPSTIKFSSDYVFNNDFINAELQETFNNNNYVQNLYLPPKLNTSNISDMENAFNNDTHLTNLILSKGFDTRKAYNNVNGLSDMFYNDKDLQSLTIQSSNTIFNSKAKLPTTKWYLKDANDSYTSPTPVNLADGQSHIGTWETTKNPKPLSYSDIYHSFDGLSKPTMNVYTTKAPNGWAFVNIDSNNNITKIYSITNASNGVVKVAPIYNGMIYKYNKSNNSVEFISGTPNPDLKDFINNAPNTIKYASSITFDDDIDFSHVTNMSHMFTFGQESTLNLGNKFNTSDVTDMKRMFAGDGKLKSLTLPSGFSTASVYGHNVKKNNMNGMFYATPLNQLTINSSNAKLDNTVQLPSMYKQFNNKDNSGYYYTSDTPNNFNVGDTGTFVLNSNPQPSTNVAYEHIRYEYKHDTATYHEGSDIIIGTPNSKGTANGESLKPGWHLTKPNNTFTFGTNGSSNVDKVDVSPDSNNATIQYTYNGKVIASDSDDFHGYDARAKDAGNTSTNITTANDAGIPANYHLVNESTNVPFNGDVTAVTVAPNQVTDTVNYVYNGKTIGSHQFTGNDVNAKDALNTTFDAGADVPTHYHTLNNNNNISYDGKTHTVNVTINPYTDTISYHDIYSDIDGMTNPSNGPIPSGTGKYQIKNSDVPDGYALVDTWGHIVNNSTDDFNYDNGNHILNVAPVWDGMTYKYDKSIHSLEFIDGTPTKFSSLPDSNVTQIIFDNSVPTQLSGDWRQVNGSHYSYTPNELTSGNHQGTFIIPYAVQPETNNAIVQYTYNGKVVASDSHDFHGNDIRAKDASNTSTNITAANDAGIPANYHLVNVSTNVPYNGHVTSVAVAPNQVTDTVNYMYNGKIVGSHQFTGNDVNAKDALSTTFDAGVNVPTHYHAVNSNNTISYDGQTHTVDVAINPYTDTISYHDIYSDIDKMTNPSNRPISSGTGKYQIKNSDIPRGYALVDTQGHIVNNSIDDFSYDNGNHILNVAPVWNGMTYKYDKSNHSLEFIDGTPKTFSSLPESNVTQIIFDKSVPTQLSGDWRQVNGSHYSYTPNELTSGNHQGTFIIPYTVQPETNKAIVQYIYNGKVIASDSRDFHGNDARAKDAGNTSTNITAANDAGIPANYHLVNASTNVPYNGDVTSVAIAPNQVTDTVNYMYNGKIVGSHQFTGNYADASGALNTTFDAGVNVPTHYHAVNSNNTISYDGQTHTVDVAINPYTDTISYHDIYSDIDKMTNPSNRPISSGTGKYQIKNSDIPRGYALVDTQGHIVNNSTDDFSYDNGNHILNVAPVWNGMTYKDDKSNHSLKFIDGTPTTFNSLPDNEATQIIFDKSVPTQLSGDWRQVNGSHYSYTPNELTSGNHQGTFIIPYTVQPEVNNAKSVVKYIYNGQVVGSDQLTGNSNEIDTITKGNEPGLDTTKYHLDIGSTTVPLDNGIHYVAVIPNQSAHSSNNGNRGSQQSSVIPSPSQSTNNGYVPAPAPIMPITTPTSETSNGNAVHNTTAPVNEEPAVNTNNVSAPFIHHLNNLNQLAVGQTGNYHGTNVTRINTLKHFRYFCMIKNSLAHTNPNSVGTDKDYVNVMHPRDHYTFFINGIFKVQQRGKRTSYCYEFRAKFGKHYHYYFATDNNRFTKNAYLQPRELRNARDVSHRYFNARVVYNTAEFKTRYFTHKSRVKALRKGTILHIKRIINIGKKGYGQTRFQLTNGNYVTANRNFVKLINHYGYKVTRLRTRNHFRYFRLTKNALAHRDPFSIGSNKDYSKVMQPREHATYYINGILKVQAGKRSFHCYEFRAKFGKHARNYFVTANKHFVQNAYVQPHELRKVHGVFRPYYKAQVILNTAEFKDPRFTHKNRVKALHKGAIVRIKRIISIGRKSSYMTRCQLTDGHYVTSNRNFIKLIK